MRTALSRRPARPPRRPDPDPRRGVAGRRGAPVWRCPAMDILDGPDALGGSPMTATTEPRSEQLGDEELDRIDALWRAANYLSVGQIYLLDNPLLREPLRDEHVKPRLLGHFG